MSALRVALSREDRKIDSPAELVVMSASGEPVRQKLIGDARVVEWREGNAQK